MSILINKETRLLVQGATGREGRFHSSKCLDYGTNVIAGVTPGRGGEVLLDEIPIYNTVEDAFEETNPNTSLIFVTPRFAADAIIEAADVGIHLIVCITEGIPVHDMVRVSSYLRNKDTILVGPNCPGVISPGDQCKVGIMPSDIHTPGRIGVVSRSGTLTYEAVFQLTMVGLGQSTCVGIGGDPVVGSSFVDILKLFNDDEATDAIIMIGEIGGSGEQLAAEYIKDELDKPIASLIVGQSAPAGRRMGHAGAIVTGNDALASEKIKALSSAGAAIIPRPGDIGVTIEEILKDN